MKLQPYLYFGGDGRDAMGLYQRVLGGEVVTMMTYGEGPPGLAGPEWQDRILHATLKIGDQELQGSDAPPDRYQPPAGFDVTIALDDLDEARRIFDALSEGGMVTMAMQETFWTRGFAMLTDRFGVRWMINCG
jgi:PhnB protein